MYWLDLSVNLCIFFVCYICKKNPYPSEVNTNNEQGTKRVKKRQIARKRSVSPLTFQVVFSPSVFLSHVRWFSSFAGERTNKSSSPQLPGRVTDSRETMRGCIFFFISVVYLIASRLSALDSKSPPRSQGGGFPATVRHTWTPEPCRCSICALIVCILLMTFFWCPTSEIPKLITSLLIQTHTHTHSLITTVERRRFIYLYIILLMEKGQESNSHVYSDATGVDADQEKKKKN